MLKIERKYLLVIKMNAGELLVRLTTKTKFVICKLEKLNAESVKSSFDIKFNETCINECIYTYVHTH